MLQTARRAATAATLLATTLGTACLPYTVASTAHTVAPHDVAQTTIAYLVPNGIDVADHQPDAAMPGVDFEMRYGLDERTDVGVRVPSGSGLIATWKRQTSGDADGHTAATAVMVGAGVVNWAQHAHAELSLLASGPERFDGGVTPYGGLRVMQVAPITRYATHDTPTAGGFFGLRIGDHLRGISPELGVYYDHSALGLRHGNIIVVPAIALYDRHARPVEDTGAGSGGAPPRRRSSGAPMPRPTEPLPGTPRAPRPFPPNGAATPDRATAPYAPTARGVTLGASADQKVHTPFAPR